MEEYLLDPQLAALLTSQFGPKEFEIIFGNITALRDFHKGFVSRFILYLKSVSQVRPPNYFFILSKTSQNIITRAQICSGKPTVSHQVLYRSRMFVRIPLIFDTTHQSSELNL